MTVMTNLSKTLMDITGEPRPQLAIIELMKDAIEHRMEKIESGIKVFEKKYHATFEDFKKKYHAGKIKGSYSYKAETDYLDWEGLLSRHSNYKSLLSSLL